jgi:predicted DsbA family dithiol-disulfide isomerase
MNQPKASPAYACPWCPYTEAVLKKVLNHMESAHHHCWCDLALSVDRTTTEHTRGDPDDVQS